MIGPLADEPAEQLGTWVFDGDPARSVTPLAALHAMLEGEVEIDHVRALETTRSRDRSQFDAAFAAAQSADMAIFFIGE